jgi:O-succinylbenzoic acid--CoA ligase
VNTSLLEKIQELGSAVYHSYGMTETISHVAIRQLNKDNATDYFVTLDGIEIHVNEESCLDISSNYFEEVVYTNDIVELIAHNKFIWKGRKDNVINTGGVKVYPEIVEQKMDKILSNSFFIIGSPDAILGEKVCLVIESDCGIDPKTIKNQLSVVLDKFEIPKDIYILSEFLRTPTEKIRRKDTFEKAIKKQYISS